MSPTDEPTTMHNTYMTDKIGPLPFCPGCGHHVLIQALNKALVKLQLEPKQVVIVTDIGCIGLVDRYFITDAFHGLHGRSITYACGLKLARPELTVIALKGDGGCGIGGTHLLNVARRNIGITLIVGNNFNYGMTGGQHSVTTPTDGLTSTTPWGNVEGPMDLCGTVIAAGGAWVARATMFDKDLTSTIVQAIEQPGFAMVDVWELCTAYYSMRNQIKKKELNDMLGGYGFKLGVLEDNPRTEYSEHYRQAFEADRGVVRLRLPIETGFDNNIASQTGIVIAGSAGQKIKSAATLFAQGAMFGGLEATQKDDYPITVMTGHSLSEVIVSRQRIEYTAIDSPDYFLVLSTDGVKKARTRIEQLSEKCTLYAEQSLELPITKAKVVRLPFNDTAGKIHKLTIAVVALATMLEDTEMFPTEAYATAIDKFQKPSVAELCHKALEAGIGLSRKRAGAGIRVADKSTRVKPAAKPAPAFPVHSPTTTPRP